MFYATLNSDDVIVRKSWQKAVSKKNVFYHQNFFLTYKLFKTEGKKNHSNIKALKTMTNTNVRMFQFYWKQQ